MSARSTPASAPRPLPEGWVDHPKIPITPRAILAGVVILVLGIVGAAASIYARRTQLQQTAEFFGDDAIVAIQILPQVTLRLEPVGLVDADGATVDVEPKTIDLSGTPGLGHLRHAFLDQRHYDWDSLTEPSVLNNRTADTQIASVTFADPKENFASATLHVELTEGWVSPDGQTSRVRLIDRARPAVRHFLTVISNAKQAHYDNRAKDDR